MEVGSEFLIFAVAYSVWEHFKCEEEVERPFKGMNYVYVQSAK